jgi:hypothetical protein
VSDDETGRPPAAQPAQPAQPSQAYAPGPYAPQPQSGVSGWTVAFAVVLVLALGGLAAAIISKGDSGKTTATIPTVTSKTTTVQKTTTVTTPAPSTNVTVAPTVTLGPSGTPATETGSAQTSTAPKTTSTP